MTASRTVVVSNYNTDPAEIVADEPEALIFDQSDDPAVAALVAARYPTSTKTRHTGHNLSDYFRFFSESWTDLPDVTVLAKGNLIGRHVSRRYWDRVRRNEHYTLLYEDSSYRGIPGVSSLLFEGAFLERNDSWYVDSKPHRYFSRYDQVLDFLFVEPIHPEWILFSPGGCYIVPRANVRQNPPGLYRALDHISSYRLFPAEAYFVERIMHTAFTANYDVQPYIRREDDMLEALEALPDRSADRAPRPALRERLVRRLSR